MPSFVIVIVVLILVLTAYIIVHPNPMFEDTWELYSWRGPHVDQFANSLKLVTFALGENKEFVTLADANGKVQSMEFELDEISGSEVRSHVEKNGIKFTLNYDLVPFERVVLTLTNQNGIMLAEMVFTKTEPIDS